MNRITDLRASCQASSEIAALKSRSGAAEARLAAAREQSQSAQEEAEEWKRKRKYDIAVREAKAALEKAAIVQHYTNKQTQLREDALREEFSGTLAEKAAESKIRNYESEISPLRLEIKKLTERLKIENARAQSYEKDVMVIQQEIKEVQERCQNAGRLAMERLAHIERAERKIENLEREKDNLEDELQRVRDSEKDVLVRVSTPEKKVEQREKDIDSLLKMEHTGEIAHRFLINFWKQNVKHVLRQIAGLTLSLSLQLQSAQAKIDSLHQELTKFRLNETILDSELKTASRGKRLRVDDDIGVESKLKQELTKHNYGDQLLELKNPNKKAIIALYEKCVLQKS
ncbi:hypothetical protein GLYMA_15G078400v4 [Glycine max]|uniref:Uncharacterized protein n=1 Tax=Glycine max TaxID=3847 RepID=A0A0R0G5R2_SOYBN|nr:hypothetical protein GYH30_041683 [Glycine max]KRH10947.1 hypothetical protein GLYMA_15G078400v4 [Glycine max]